MRIPPVKAIIAFESVARTKSVSRASEELGLTASAVSHQIGNLEEALSQALFFRQGRGLVLTPVGEQYLRDVTGVLADLNRATERAASPANIDPASPFESQLRPDVAIAASGVFSGRQWGYSVEPVLLL